MAKSSRSTPRTDVPKGASKKAGPDPKAIERYMRGSADPQGQQDFQALTGSGAAQAAPALPQDGAQQQQPSPEEAGYQQAPAQCDGCSNFGPDGTCSFLSIPVETTDYCQAGYSPAAQPAPQQQQQSGPQAGAAAPQVGMVPQMALGGQGGPSNG